MDMDCYRKNYAGGYAGLINNFDKAMNDRPDLDLLTSCALHAGRIAIGYFGVDPKQWNKGDGSPVSEADLAVNDLLQSGLLGARPDYGWLSEESKESPIPESDGRIFVIDPIDGTRGFLRGDDRWCISIAVVCNGRPEAAVLFAPAMGRLFNASAGHGAWAWRLDEGWATSETISAKDLTDDGTLAVSKSQTILNARVEGPKRWLQSKPFEVVAGRPAGSIPSLAWRFGLVASGEVDAAIAKARSHDWDLAASDLLVEQAGGAIVDLSGRAPIYNQGNREHSVLVAGNAEIRQSLINAALEAMDEGE